MRVLATILVAGGLAFAQEQQQQQKQGENKPLPRVSEVERESRHRAKEADAVFGKLKSLENGRRVIVAVDNAPDKAYILGSTKRVVTVAEDLAVGDPVRVYEDKQGVHIVRDTRNASK